MHFFAFVCRFKILHSMIYRLRFKIEKKTFTLYDVVQVKIILL